MFGEYWMKLVGVLLMWYEPKPNFQYTKLIGYLSINPFCQVVFQKTWTNKPTYEQHDLMKVV